MNQRRYKFKNILNCRDLGGYPSEYGVTQFGRFLRAGIVEYPEQQEIEKLSEYGVKTAIDLRGDFEFSDMNPHTERIDGCTSMHIPLYEANVANADGDGKTLADIYCSIVDENCESIGAVLEAIANAPDGAIMYHCYFGKDRTGILTLLLLTIAGVAEEDIIADYQITYTYIREYVENNSDILWSSDKTMHYSMPETLIYLVEHLKNKYGSVMNYIVSTGISNDSIERIRRRFF